MKIVEWVGRMLCIMLMIYPLGKKEFGFSLIHRSRNGVKLTEEGKSMLISMRRVLLADELLHQEAANILGVTKGKVRIGLISSISTKWMPNLIQIMEKKEEILDQEMEDLIAERQAARKAKNFARADEIRDELLAKGIILKDTREGVKWKRA